MFCFLLFNEYYYLDGVEFHLHDGSIIKTAAEFEEDPYYYTWFEEGVPVTIEKKRVRSIQYFSMKVAGRPPKKPYKNSVQRRITGRPVGFSRDGRFFLPCRHVYPNGRSAEGANIPNYVKEIEQGQAQNGDLWQLEAQFTKTSPGYEVEFRLYSLKGGLLLKTFCQSDDLAKGKPKKPALFAFFVPSTMDLQQIGLVEVINKKIEEDP